MGLHRLAHHYGDETITAQIAGDEEILLLPPDRLTFEIMKEMSRRGVWKVSPPSWPDAFRALVPARATLSPGDAVCIPMNWWHAVEVLDDDFNITVARVFRSPLRWMADVRLGNVRAAVLASSGAMAVASLRAFRPRRVRQWVRMIGCVSFGLPSALWCNRRPNTPAAW